MNKYLELILSLPKSIYLNFRMLPFREAVRLPILVRYNTILSNCSGKLLLFGGIRFGYVRFGFGHVGCFDKRDERTIWDVGGVLEIRGNAYIGTGSRIVVGGNGYLVFGNSFVNTAKITIICFRRIEFGDNVLTSWDNLIMDTDFHRIKELEKNTDSEIEKDVIVGNHVWIGCRATLLKGTHILDNSVVAAGTVVSKKIKEASVLLAGNPSEIKRRGITWEQ